MSSLWGFEDDAEIRSTFRKEKIKGWMLFFFAWIAGFAYGFVAGLMWAGHL